MAKLYPAVPRHWLFAIAGGIWFGVGTLLCFRAMLWLAPLTLAFDILLTTLAVLLAITGYVLFFSKVVEKNVTRIHTLPEQVCVFAFTPWRGYCIIGVMITFSFLLRNSSLPKKYL